MKFLAVLFFVGFALASAVPVPSHDLSLEDADDVEFLSFAVDSDDEEIKSELVKELRRKLGELLEKIKDGFEKGKFIKEELLDKLKDLKQRLRDLNVDMGNKAKELLKELKQKLRDAWKEIWDKYYKRESRERLDVLLSEDESDFGQRLKNKLQNILEKLKEALDRKGGRYQKFLEKAKKILEKLKEMKVELGDKIKDVLNEVKEKIRDYLNRQLDDLDKEKRAFDYKDLLRKLKEKIQSLKDRIDPEKVKEIVERVFGKGSEVADKIHEFLKNKGGKLKQIILDYIDRILEDQKNERSLKDRYEKVRDYLEKVGIELKENFVRFGEWAKSRYEKGLEKGKDKAETLKRLAREFIYDARNIPSDLAQEAKLFFHEQRHYLGTWYEDVVKIIDLDVFDGH